MSRKHFVAIAAAIKESCDESGVCMFTRTKLATTIACALKQFNPAFKTDRFVKACGVTS